MTMKQTMMSNYSYFCTMIANNMNRMPVSQVIIILG